MSWELVESVTSAARRCLAGITTRFSELDMNNLWRLPARAAQLRALCAAFALGGCLTLLSMAVYGAETAKVLTIHHYVRVRSTVPAIAGQWTALYVRERVKAGSLLGRSAPANRVVLFIHGSGAPSEVVFDVPYQDYSWMAF